MSGHSKWSQIKHQKGITDKKRGQLFSKLLRAIAIAARQEPNPQFNPRLRSAIETAKESNVPGENIERAISKASSEKSLTDVLIEAYGPGGIQMIILGITDNTNRTVSEIKHLLSEHESKIAAPGSVVWAFDSTPDLGWRPKFPQAASEEIRGKMSGLIDALDERDDVQDIITNLEELS